jgi:hypothetical protein
MGKKGAGSGAPDKDISSAYFRFAPTGRRVYNCGPQQIIRRTLVRNTWCSISRKENKMLESDHNMRAHSNEPMIIRTKVFISYAHKDAKFMEEFRRMLQPMIGDEFELWTDNNIDPGEDWNSKIEKAMQSSSIALLLVSDHFLESSYIMKVEVQSILQMHVSEGSLQDKK